MSLRIGALCLLLAVLCPSPGFSQQAVPSSEPTSSSMASQAMVPRFPTPHRSIEMDIVVADDGSEERRVRVTERFASYADKNYVLSVLFDAERGPLAFDYVRVRRSDGRTEIVESPAAIAPRPANVIWWGYYFGIHEATVRVGAVGLLDVVEYAYRHSRPAVFPGHFVMEEDWMSTWLARSGVVTLHVPASLQVQVKTRVGQPDVTIDDGVYGYRWAFTRDDEYGEVPAPIVRDRHWSRPNVRASSFRSWEQVGDAIRRFGIEPAQPTDTVRAKATELTRDLGSDALRVDALHRFVAQEIANVDSIVAIGPLPPASPDVVLERGSGTGLEKHRLLEALLRAIGIEAIPALVSAGSILDRDFPSPAQFNHALTTIERVDGAIWIDTRLPGAPAGHLRASERNTLALRLPSAGPVEIVTTPAAMARLNRVTWNAEGEFNAHGALALRVHAVLSGDTEVSLREQLLAAPAERWQRVLWDEGILPWFGGTMSEIEVLALRDATAPLEIRLALVQPERVAWQAPGEIDMPLPVLYWRPDTEDVPAGMPESHVVVGPAMEATFDVLIRLPAGVRGGIRQGTSGSNDETRDFAVFRQRFEFRGGVLTAHRTLRISEPHVSRERGAELREFWTRVRESRPTMVMTEVWPWRLTSTPNLSAANGADERANRLVTQALAAPPPVAFGLLQTAVEIEPSHPTAWSLLGERQMSTSDGVAAGEASLRRQIDEASSASAYKRLGLALARIDRLADAADAYRAGAAAYPQDRDLPALFGEVLLEMGQPAEAAVVLAAEVEQRPRSSRLRFALGRAYLEIGRVDDGVAEFRTAIDFESTWMMWLGVARRLSDAETALDLALKLGTDAVAALSARTASATFATWREGIDVTHQLAYAFETLGGIYVRRGEIERGGSYCRAAWEIGFRTRAATCLGQVAAAQGNASEARGYRAMGSMPSRDPLPGGGFEPAVRPIESLTPEILAIVRELGVRRAELESFAIDRPARGAGRAVVEIITGADGVIREVRFLEPPSPDYYSLMASLLDLRIGPTLPEGIAARLVRRAVVTCAAGDSPTCEMRVFR